MNSKETQAISLPDGIDWDQDFEWAQDYGQVTANSVNGDMVAVSDAHGQTWSMDPDAFARRYMSTGRADQFKRHFDPVKAHVFEAATDVRLNGEVVALEAGDAVCRSVAGTVEVVRRSKVAADYLVVAWEPTAEPPFQAFAYAS